MFIGSAIATGSYSSMVAGTPAADTAYTPLLLDNPHSVFFSGGNLFQGLPCCLILFLRITTTSQWEVGSRTEYRCSFCSA